MTVNLTNLKPGDKVHFRCGGSAEYYHTSVNSGRKELFFKDHCWGVGAVYMNNGQFGAQDGRLATHPFDIIRIESVFNWKDAKPGMAFKYSDNTNPWYYLCEKPDRSEVIVCAIPSEQSSYWLAGAEITWVPKKRLTRSPSDDIEVTP